MPDSLCMSLIKKLKQEQIAKDALEKALVETSLGTVPPDPPTAEAVVKEATSILRRATVGQDGMMTGQEVTVVGVTNTDHDDIHVGRAEVLQVITGSFCHQVISSSFM